MLERTHGGMYTRRSVTLPNAAVKQNLEETFGRRERVLIAFSGYMTDGRPII